jgi:hypothetical protein
MAGERFRVKRIPDEPETDKDYRAAARNPFVARFVIAAFAGTRHVSCWPHELPGTLYSDSFAIIEFPGGTC